ncbi:helix-turn-helix domain-containing protein [Brevibacterium sp. RIT 803]|uniref:PucR family transcriptional regulator n=1 Tax=Brevibacterium sp. RIT 803 TaxID=2810210 RepID=UPI001950BE65|nr:helix-turn-helix domain-containing protein [Brevibacterium sp. RIT 803]MBM6590855.1 helix-turn-helix domain-containing protein [Brevibacterium sp. RIT 803]
MVPDLPTHVRLTQTSPGSSSLRSPLPRLSSQLTLERILDDLGSTLLNPLTTIAEPHQAVTGVVAFDPHDDQIIPAGSIVLGIGLADSADIRRCLGSMAAAGARVLIVRGPGEVLEPLSRAAYGHGICVFTLVSGASWTQLSNLINSLLVDPRGVDDTETIDGLPGGDLFAVANAIGSLLGAPITIEDRNSRVLAFSSGQDAADGPRIETILDRQVPVEYTRRLQSAGFFTRLYSSTDPVSIRLDVDGVEIKNRVAIAVRAGGEILGSVWAALPDEIDEERAQILKDMAKIAALHMLRLRAGDGLDRRLRADLLATALEGGDGAEYAIRKLGVESSPIAVFALGVDPDESSQLDEAIETQRIADAINVYLAAVRPQASAARLGGTIFGILPVNDVDAGEAQTQRLVNDLVARVGTRVRVCGGIGPIVTDSRDLLSAREGARRALRVCLDRGDRSVSVAVLSRVYVDSLLLDLRDQVSLRHDQLTGPVHRLHDYDLSNHTDFVLTLDTWLACMGDVSKAADLLHVHANTLRYRLRRLAEIADLDLEDPDARFAAQLLLRIDPQLASGDAETHAGP